MAVGQLPGKLVGRGAMTGTTNCTSQPHRFPLGRLVITTNAARTLTPREMHDALRRHESGDWGDLPAEDASQNDAALCQSEGRLFSAYGEGDGKFWIITEADRSVTTILLPDDY
jgi:hypothetical protein